MATFKKQLSGARDYEVWLTVTQGSQSYDSNYTDVNWSLSVHGTWGSWTEADVPYSININGTVYSGTYTGHVDPNPSQTFRSGSTRVYHGSTGYKTLSASGYINIPHSNVGSGTASGSLTLSRIPKPPAAPTPVGIDEVTSSSFRYRFSGNSNNGAAILEWQAQLATNADFTTGVQTVTSNGTTTFSSLPAGVTYWVRSRGRNSRGWGAWSSSLSVKVGLPAPTLTSWTQNASGGLVAAWTAPSATNGLTGYRLQIARDAGFTTGVRNIDIGNVLTRTVTGLAGGRIYYARVSTLR